jgi:excisionase family DNA binding protein
MTVWFTAAQAAEYIHVSEPIIRDAVKRGDLQAYGIGKGRNFRLKASDIDAWLEGQSWEPRQSA